MDNQELNHAGIKGMKWGIRRWQNKDGSLTPAGKKRYGDNDDYEQHEDSYKARTKKPASAMSDKELADAILRKQREDQYNQMFAPKKSKGRQFVEEVVTDVGKQLAKDYTKKLAKGAIDLSLDSLGVKYQDKQFGKLIKDLGLMSKDGLKNLEKKDKVHIRDVGRKGTIIKSHKKVKPVMDSRLKGKKFTIKKKDKNGNSSDDPDDDATVSPKKNTEGNTKDYINNLFKKVKKDPNTRLEKVSFDDTSDDTYYPAKFSVNKSNKKFKIGTTDRFKNNALKKTRDDSDNINDEPDNSSDNSNQRKSIIKSNKKFKIGKTDSFTIDDDLLEDPYFPPDPVPRKSARKIITDSKHKNDLERYYHKPIDKIYGDTRQIKFKDGTMGYDPQAEYQRYSIPKSGKKVKLGHPGQAQWINSFRTRLINSDKRFKPASDQKNIRDSVLKKTTSDPEYESWYKLGEKVGKKRVSKIAERYVYFDDGTKEKNDLWMEDYEAKQWIKERNKRWKNLFGE